LLLNGRFTECPPPWSYFVELYFKERTEHIKSWRETHSVHTLEDYYLLLESLKLVELASMSRVEKYKCLSGVYINELIERGQTIKTRAGAIDALSKFVANNRTLHIISTNWSRDMLFGCLQKVHGLTQKSIISNDLVFREGC